MCRIFHFLSAVALIFVSCSPNNYVFVGTYTKQQSNGIYVYQFDQKAGGLTPVSHTNQVNDPSYLALSKNKKYLYAVNEGNGTVASFSFDKKKGQLHLLNRQSSEGGAPCYVAVDNSGKFLTIANYSGGNFVVYPIGRDGKILPAVQNIRLIAKSNTKKSNAHTTVFSPDNKFLYVTDLGADKLYQYKFSAMDSQPVDTKPAVYTLPEGYGPRHIAINKKDDRVYLLNEWEGNISVFRKAGGMLQHTQDIVSTSLAAPGNKNKGSAAIKISPDGKFIYASNRVATDNIAIFKINADGSLTRVGEQKTGGHPRDFMINKSGNYLLAASRDDNAVRIYSIDKITGLLTDTGREIKVSMPVMLLEY